MAGTLYVENVKLGRKITLDELCDLALFKKASRTRSSPRCLTGQHVGYGQISSIRWPNNYLLTSLPPDEEGLVADLAAALWIDPERSVEGMDIEIGYCLTQSLIL